MQQDTPLRVGIFSTVAQADDLVSRLLESGFKQDQITVVCSDAMKEDFFRAFAHQQPAGTHTFAAATAGGAVGAAVGALGTVGVVLATGGVGLLAVGGIAAWTGGILGGFVGAMMTRGVEKELANYYEQAVQAGKILVAVESHLPSELAQAERLFHEAGAEALELPEG